MSIEIEALMVIGIFAVFMATIVCLLGDKLDK